MEQKKYPISYIFKFIANSFISLYYFFKYQPEVIVTTGTHTAVPMCYIAKNIWKQSHIYRNICKQNKRNSSRKTSVPNSRHICSTMGRNAQNISKISMLGVAILNDIRNIRNAR